MKKPFYKRWWFFVVVAVVVLGGIGAAMDGGEVEEVSIESTTKEDDQGTKEEPVELTIEERIEKRIEDRVKEEYQTTSVNKISVNQDMGTGEGYILLAYLSFDAKNRAKTAKGMIDMYGEDLGAYIADEKEVNSVTVFWEVPYLNDSGNIAKLMMERKGEGMAIVDRWYAPLFNK